MVSAPSPARIAAALLACTLTGVFSPLSFATTIDLSLNVFYANPADVNSGGTWELIAKSSIADTFGISGINARLRNISSVVQIEGPRGVVNGSNAAGFQLLGNFFFPPDPPDPAYRDLTIAQLPIAPLPGGDEQSLFYGVGTLTNGSPTFSGQQAGTNSIGPTFTSLTNLQDIPWATGDSLGNATWATAARMASGTFSAGVSPLFHTGSTGNVFTSVGTSTLPGNEALATTITTIVRTNAGQSADYNHNGIVDAPDYVIWRKTFNTAAIPAGSGADGNGDGIINMPDYDLWCAHFGNPFGAGSGAGLSTSTVPEPASGVMIAIVAVLAITARPRHTPLVNN